MAFSRRKQNETDYWGRTPLHRAAYLGNINSVGKLINAGADVNKTDNEGETALISAALQWGNKDVVFALIDAGADVNKRNNEGKTALLYAAQHCANEGVVHALIDAAADVNKTDNEGKTALICAAQQRDNEGVVRALIDAGADVNKTDNEGKTALIYAAQHCANEGVVHALIDAGADVNKTDNEGKTALFYAAQVWVNEGVVRALIDNGADVSKTDNEGKTALFYAAQVLDNEGVVRALIDAGALFNTRDHDSITPLFCAITMSSTLANYLHEKGTSLCLDDKYNSLTFLIEKSYKSNFDLRPRLKLLTEKKMVSKKQIFKAIINVAFRNICSFRKDDFFSLLRLAKEYTSVVDVELKRRIKKISKNEHKDQMMNMPEVVGEILSLLVKVEADPNSVDSDGNTALHHAVQLSSNNIPEGTILYICNQLKEMGTSLHAKNKNGETPLHLCRTWTAVELLLAAGANPNDVDSSGRSPLLAAAKNSKLIENGGSIYPDALLPGDKFWRKVLAKGLDPWTVDIHEESVLSVLMEAECHDLARALIHVACGDKRIRSRPLVLLSLLTAICKDKSLNAQWKKDAAETILSSTKCPVNGNDGEDAPLHYCCRNVVEVENKFSTDDLKLTVHWEMVELLRSYGADYRIPDATGQSCLDIAKKCPALKDLLMEPIDLDRFPVLIKPWKSVSKIHERCLAKVARHLESNHVEPYWYYKDHLAFGSFGTVFAGINEKDGREVAVKRIENFRMVRPQDQREITSLTALADCEQIVRYLSFFQDKDFSYIVLELMEGNLEDLLNRSMSMKDKEALCVDVVKGLSYMHSQGYLHRDLKPSNILFKHSPKLCLKIADFGLCREDDSTRLTTVYGTNPGTRSWIAPEVLTTTKHQHSKASDMFSCGLVLHYFLSEKKHPFSPKDCANKGELQICNETETNIIDGNQEGWDGSLSPEATHPIERLLESDGTKRPTAEESLAHPLFWSKTKKIDLLIAVGNQPASPLSSVESDLEASFDTTVKHVQWNDPGYAHMPAIYAEMTKKRKPYYTSSVVELVRFIRNAYAHVSESTRPTPIRKLLLEDFVFLEYFPNLVMEVYKAVTTHGWDQTREEIKYVMKK